MCPRLGGSAFFENGQRDLGVSSKAHKFACELRALLASDKHLGSAERSERQLPTPNTPASARGTVADLPAYATAADPSISVIGDRWPALGGERSTSGRGAASVGEGDIRHSASGTRRRVCFSRSCLSLRCSLSKCLSLARSALRSQANL